MKYGIKRHYVSKEHVILSIRTLYRKEKTPKGYIKKQIFMNEEDKIQHKFAKDMQDISDLL